MHTNELSADQLESIRRLLIDPLREAVKAEVALGHGQLRQAVEQLAGQVTAQSQANARLADASDKRLIAVEVEVAKFGSFRSRVLVVYGFLAAGLGLLWSIVRDRLITRFTGHGP